MTISFFKKIALFLYLLSSSLSALNIQDLKGTYTILKPEYQHLSPLHGAVWWETGLVRKYYEFGNYEKITEEKKASDDKLYSVTRIEGDATMKLIHRLFNSVGGSFGVTDSPDNPEYYFTPAIIGKIMALIETAESTELENLIKTVVGKDKEFKTLLDAKEKELKESTDPQVKKINKQKVTGYLNGDFIKALVGSLTECGSDEKAIYPVKTTQAILLAFLHRKANNKQDLKAYFDALQGQIAYQEERKQKNLKKKAEAKAKAQIKKDDEKKEDKECKEKVEKKPDFKTIFVDEKFSVGLPDEWVGLRAEMGALQKLREVMGRINFTIEKKAKIIFEHIAYEGVIIAELMHFYMGELPNIAEYRTINLDSTFGLPGILFPDCMDTTMRNISNIVCYDVKDKVFSFNAHEGVNLKPSDECKAFYTAFKNPAMIAEQSIHVAWTKVVENIPGALYVNARSKDSETVLDRSDAQFVYVNGLDERKLGLPFEDKGSYKEVKIHGRTYRLVNSDQFVCYELKASVRNLIIILNHIFGLGLFKDSADPEGKEFDINQAFTRPDFNKIYFQALCNKLKWTLEGIGVEDVLDEKDYRSFLEIKLKLTELVMFSLSINARHGYVEGRRSYNENKPLVEYLFAQLSKEEERTYFHVLSLLAMYRFDLYDIPGYEKTVVGQHLCFMQDLLDVNARLKVVVLMVHSNKFIKSYDDFVAKLIASFAINEDFYYQRAIVESLATHEFDTLTGKNVPIKLSPKIKKELDIFVVAADSSIQKGDLSNLCFGLLFFKSLVCQGLGFEKAISAAQKGIFSDNQNVKKLTCELFKQLVERGKGIDEVLIVIGKIFFDYSAYAAVELFKLLFKQNEGLEQAKEVLEKAKKKSEIDLEVKLATVELESLIVQKEAELKNPREVKIEK